MVAEAKSQRTRTASRALKYAPQGGLPGVVSLDEEQTSASHNVQMAHSSLDVPVHVTRYNGPLSGLELFRKEGGLAETALVEATRRDANRFTFRFTIPGTAPLPQVLSAEISSQGRMEV